MKKSDFYFDLPERLIAQHPLEQRDASRMMVLDRKDGSVTHRHFHDMLEYVKPGDCIVFNNSRVIPARLMGHAVGHVTPIEVLLLTDKGDGLWECLTRPGRKTRAGVELTFGDGLLTATVEAVQPDDAFIFNDPGELSSDELFRLFLWWTNRSALEKYRNPDDGWFYFPSSAIHRTLDCYFRRYSFDITQCAGYDTKSGTVVDQTAALEPGNLRLQRVSKTMDGHKVTYVVDFYPVLDALQVGPEHFARKEYTLLCYPGDFYIESARYVPLDGAAAQ